MTKINEKIHVIKDEDLGGIEREYVEVGRKAKDGDTILLDTARDKYRTLKPTNIVHINGERFRTVERKAEVGERIISLIDDPLDKNDFEKGSIHTVLRGVDCGDNSFCVDIGGERGFWKTGEYRVLEPVENSEKADDIHRAVDRLQDLVIKQSAEIHRLQHEVKYLRDLWRDVREVQLGMHDEMEALKCKD